MRVSKFTGAIVAGAIAITSAFATPAAAASDGNRLATILLGAAAVGLVVHTVKKNKKSRATVVSHNAYRSRGSHTIYNQHRPKNCLRKKYTNHGWKTYYSRKCLEQQRNRHNNGYSEANHHNHNRYDDGNHGRRNNHNRYNNHRRHDNHYPRNGFYEFQRRANDKK